MNQTVDQRLVRIETALVLLCQHLGLNPRNGERLAGDMHRPNHEPKTYLVKRERND